MLKGERDLEAGSINTLQPIVASITLTVPRPYWLKSASKVQGASREVVPGSQGPLESSRYTGSVEYGVTRHETRRS